MSFDGCRDRIKRASSHREALRKIWEDFLEEDFYYPSVDVQGDGTGAIYVIQDHDLPGACALELGECLYQLRAALDGSVYQAAIVNSGKNPPPDEKCLEFPICFRESEFQAAGWKIKPLAQQCKGLIESVQPYKAPKLSTTFAAAIQDFDMNRAIGMLNDWARKDRHRQLHVIASWASRANPHLRIPEGARLKSISLCGDGFLEHHNQIASFEIEGFVPGMKVQANPDLLIDIAVDEVPRPQSLSDTLGSRLARMIATVTVVVDAMEEQATGSA